MDLIKENYPSSSESEDNTVYRKVTEFDHFSPRVSFSADNDRTVCSKPLQAGNIVHGPCLKDCNNKQQVGQHRKLDRIKDKTMQKIKKIDGYKSKRRHRLCKEKAASSNESEVVEKDQKISDVSFVSEKYEQLRKENSTPPDLINVPTKVRSLLHGHTKGVNCVRWNNNHPHILASAAMDSTVRVWDALDSSKCVLVVDSHSEGVKDVKWSLDGKSILSGGFDKSVRITDVETGTCSDKYIHKEYISSLAIHPNNKNLFLAAGYRSGVVCWDIRCHQVVTQYRSTFGEIQDVCFFPNDSSKFITSSTVIKRNATDKSIIVWDFLTGSILSNQIYMEAFNCPSIRFHPKKNTFVAQSSANYIAIFSASKYILNKRKRFEGHDVGAYHIQCSFNKYGTVLATGDSRGYIYFYNFASSAIFSRLKAHQNVCMAAEFHPCLTSTLASCGWDSIISIYR